MFSLLRLTVLPGIYTNEQCGLNLRVKLNFVVMRRITSCSKRPFSGKQEFLVSGDKDLVDDEKLKAEVLKCGVKVVSVAEFVEVLRERGLI
jgi:hypothetical protein